MSGQRVTDDRSLNLFEKARSRFTAVLDRNLEIVIRTLFKRAEFDVRFE